MAAQKQELPLKEKTKTVRATETTLQPSTCRSFH
jgi:hypothetical protein